MARTLPLLTALLLPFAGLQGVESPALLAEDVRQRPQEAAAVIASLREGDLAPLRTCPADWFLAPLGLPQSPGLLEHWTLALRRAISELDPQLQREARACLEAHYRRLASTVAPPPQRFVPAPSALAALARQADRAFDHGRFRRFLALSQDVPGGEATLRYAERRAVAQAYLGHARHGSGLPEGYHPGPLRVYTPRRVYFQDEGLHVRWQRDGSVLMARGPDGQVRWQYHGDERARVAAGSGGAVLVHAEHCQLLDEHGTLRTQACPAEAALLGVRGGLAWFANGSAVSGLSVGSSHVVGFTLPETPLIPPLVHGGDSLWLGPRFLTQVDHDHVVGRWEHDLERPEHWRFCLVDDLPGLVGPDGSHRLISHLDEALRFCADPSQAAQWQLRAGRDTAAWKQALALPPGADRVRALLRILAVRPAFIRSCPMREQLLAVDSPLALHALHAIWSLDPDLLTPDERTRLERLATQLAGTWLCADEHISPVARHWSHAYTGRLLLRLLRDGRERERYHLALGRHPDRGMLHRLDDTWLQLQILRDGGTTVLARTGEDHPLWRVSWPGSTALPSRSLSLRDGWLLVLEGQHRLTFLDPRDGRRMATVPIASKLAFPSQMAIHDPQRFAVLHPISVNTHLSLIERTGDGNRDVVTHELPTFASWIIPHSGGYLVRFHDGSHRRYPGGERVDPPPELATPERPDPTPPITK
ncbi:MAG: hypothetical protein ACOCYP_04750 [Planctomycetota bacterium]